MKLLFAAADTRENIELHGAKHSPPFLHLRVSFGMKFPFQHFVWRCRPFCIPVALSCCKIERPITENSISIPTSRICFQFRPAATKLPEIISKLIQNLTKNRHFSNFWKM